MMSEQFNEFPLRFVDGDEVPVSPMGFDGTPGTEKNMDSEIMLTAWAQGFSDKIHFGLVDNLFEHHSNDWDDYNLGWHFAVCVG